MSNQKLLTVEDFVLFCNQYCTEHKLSTFSLKEVPDVTEIIVQSPGTFSIDNTKVEHGFLPVALKACHIELNRNHSYISKENMERCLDSIYNRPILGYIIENSNGELDFDAHNIVVEDDPFNEGETRYKYLEKPIGTVPESGKAKLVYDKEQDKTYVEVQGLVYENYGNGACEIIQRKGGTKVSVELAITDMSYNAKENYMEILDFEFRGITALGEHIGEGMIGSKMTIGSFSKENNSIIDNLSNQLIISINKLNNTLSKIENNSLFTKGGNAKMTLEELLEKYNKQESDLDFDYKNMSTDELEKKFEELFDQEEEQTEAVNNEPETEPTSEEPTKEGTDEEDESDNEDEPETESENFESNLRCKRVSCNEKNTVFELSHGEINNALYELIQQYEELDNEYYYIETVYDNYFVMTNFNDVYYKQNYIKENDSIKLNGERIRLYKTYLTESEKASLESMRSEYAELKHYKEDKELEIANAKKTEELSKDCYSSIQNEEEFKNLIENMEKYSFDEIVKEADILLAKCIKSGQFSFAQTTENQKSKGIRFNLNEDTKEIKPYGNLFASVEK